MSINGSLAGFFKGMKGIRQGDSLSPYIFVLTMEILTQLLNEQAHQRKLGFHPRCKSLHLTHLCFADDSFFLLTVLSNLIGQYVLHWTYSSSYLALDLIQRNLSSFVLALLKNMQPILQPYQASHIVHCPSDTLVCL